jgi:DNA-directed RNA polymerase subunit RPC12/RpoP
MMQIRCQRCGWNFTLGRDTIGLAVAEANQGHLEYTQFICPNCRHEVKVQVEVLRKHLPMDHVLPIPQPKPEPVAVHKEESEPTAAYGAKPAAKPAPKPVMPAGLIEPQKAAAAASKKQSGTKKIAAKKPIVKKPAAAKSAAKKTTTTSRAKKSKK